MKNLTDPTITLKIQHTFGQNILSATFTWYLKRFSVQNFNFVPKLTI